jgi:hypothetical protein
MWRKGAGEHEVKILQTDESVDSVISPFDPRAVGVAGWSSFRNNVPFSEIVGPLGRDPDKVSLDGRHVYRIDWLRHPSNDKFAVRVSLWIDESNYCPVRMEFCRGQGPVDSGEWARPMLVEETSWRQVNQVWVPKALRITDVKNTGRQSYDLNFNWESVNVAIPPSQFTAEGLGLPKGTIVVDTRLGKPVITKAIGEIKVPVIVDKNAGGGYRSAIVGGSAAVLLALLALAAYRFRRSVA